MTSRTDTLATMSVGMFLVLLDVTVVNVALPSIAVDLGASMGGIQGVVDGYAVPFAALLLAAGGLADRRTSRALVTGLVVLGLASMLCALSPGLAFLVAARAGQGVGAALLLPASMTVILRTFPERGEQAMALGIWAGTSSLALPAGPVLGGVLTQTLGWQAVFWVNLPIVVAVLAVVRRLRLPSAEGMTGTPDVLGGICASVCLGAAVLAVIRLGRGDVGLGASAAVAAVIMLGLFLVVERRAVAPMLPRHLLHGPVRAATAISGLMNFVGIGTILLITLYLQAVRGLSPTAAGLVLLPLFVPLAALSPLTGRVVARWGPRPPMVAGLATGVAGSACLLLVGRTGTLLPLLVVETLLGVGMGLLTASVVSAAVRSLPASHAGLASGVNNAARQTGGALGIAAYGAIAGNPSGAGFVGGLHAAGLIGAAAWLVALALVRLLGPDRSGQVR